MPVGEGFLLIPVEQFIHLSIFVECIKYCVKNYFSSCLCLNVQNVLTNVFECVINHLFYVNIYLDVFPH